MSLREAARRLGACTWRVDSASGGSFALLESPWLEHAAVTLSWPIPLHTATAMATAHVVEHLLVERLALAIEPLGGTVGGRTLATGIVLHASVPTAEAAAGAEAMWRVLGTAEPPSVEPGRRQVLRELSATARRDLSARALDRWFVRWLAHEAAGPVESADSERAAVAALELRAVACTWFRVVSAETLLVVVGPPGTPRPLLAPRVAPPAAAGPDLDAVPASADPVATSARALLLAGLSAAQEVAVDLVAPIALQTWRRMPGASAVYRRAGSAVGFAFAAPPDACGVTPAALIEHCLIEHWPDAAVASTHAALLHELAEIVEWPERLGAYLTDALAHGRSIEELERYALSAARLDPADVGPLVRAALPAEPRRRRSEARLTPVHVVPARGRDSRLRTADRRDDRVLLLDDAQDEPATLAIAVALPERRGVQEALARAWAAAVPTAGYEIAWDCVVLDVRACAEEWDEALALLRCALASNTRPTPDVADASTDGLDVVLDPLRARPLASGVRVVAVLSAKGDLAGRRSDLWPLLDALPPDVNSPREVVAAPRWSGAAGGEREVTLAYAFEGPGGDLPGAETHLLLLHLLGHRAGLVRRLCDGEVSVGLEAGITRSVWTLRVACTAGELANVAATLEQALNQAHAPSPADLQRARALLVAQAARSAKAPAGRDRARRLARAALSEGVGPPVDLDDAAENRPLAQRRIRPFARVVLADGSAFRWDP